MKLSKTMENPQDSYSNIFGNKKRILVVMPHPDDTELYAGGTIARLLSDGKRVRVVKMTFGDRGCQQEEITKEKLREKREKEDREAMKVLGIWDEDNVYLGINDGGIEDDLKTIGKVVYQIRVFQPELIITTNPEDSFIRFEKDVNWVNHRDHRNCAKVTVDAAYPYSRDLLFFPEQLKKAGVKPHICSQFLLTDYYDHPDLVYIKVTNYIEKRVQVHASHASQYSYQDVQSSADFFTRIEGATERFERFRYVVGD